MLNREHGIMVFQCITMPESRYEAYLRGCDFIQAYIFPYDESDLIIFLLHANDMPSRTQRWPLP